MSNVFKKLMLLAVLCVSVVAFSVACDDDSNSDLLDGGTASYFCRYDEGTSSYCVPMVGMTESQATSSCASASDKDTPTLSTTACATSGGVCYITMGGFGSYVTDSSMAQGSCEDLGGTWYE